MQDITNENSVFEIKTIRDRTDQLDIRVGVKPAAAGPTKRWVIFANGRSEWIEKYCYLPADINIPNDTGFITWDHRGQGGSGGASAFVQDYNDYGSDLELIVKDVCGDKPHAAFAHSMGGLVILHASLTGKIKPKRLALCSPLLGLPNAPLPRPVAKPIGKLVGTVGLGHISTGAGKHTKKPFARNKLTHDYDLYARMQQTPYPIGGATFQWVDASFKAIAEVHDVKLLQSFNVPTLVLGGTNERVVDADAFSKWVAHAAKHMQARVQLQLVPDARHELLAESVMYYQQAIRGVQNWLKPFLNGEMD